MLLPHGRIVAACQRPFAVRNLQDDPAIGRGEFPHRVQEARRVESVFPYMPGNNHVRLAATRSTRDPSGNFRGALPVQPVLKSFYGRAGLGDP